MHGSWIKKSRLIFWFVLFIIGLTHSIIYAQIYETEPNNDFGQDLNAHKIRSASLYF